MRMTAFLLLGLASGGSGCGGSSAVYGTDAAAASADAPSLPADAAPGAGDSGAAAGTCNMPDCIAALGSACIPDGSCISELSLATMGLTICYDNGLRYQETVTSTGGGATATINASNGPTPCFTGTATSGSLVGGAVTFNLKSVAGVDIGTMTQNTTTWTTTITCKNGQPVLLNAACTGGGVCTSGTCP